MMHEFPLTFGCPSCGVKLSVPASFAGVVGPCPHCREIIRAPFGRAPAAVVAPKAEQQTPALVPRLLKPAPATVAGRAMAPGFVPPGYAVPPPGYPAGTPVGYPLPYPAPPAVAYPGVPMAGYAMPPQVPYPPPAVMFHPAHVPGSPAVAGGGVNGGSTIGRSNPTGQQPFPERKEPIPSTADVSGAPAQRPRYAANPIPMRHDRRSVLPRLIVPLLFLGAAVAVVLGLQRALEAEEKAAGPQDSEGFVPNPAENAILPEDHVPPTLVRPDGSLGPEESSQAEPATPVSAVPELEEPLELSPAGVRGLEALEKFLAAKSLEERRPLLEALATDEVLAASSLAGELPPRLNIETDIHVPHRSEDFIDVYYNVDFDAGNGRPNLQTIVVRLRGSQEPKIVADPFLDLFDGRLADYAAGPSEKGGVFHAIISADAFCWDEDVPNKEKKLTLKLMSRGNSREIARAYFSKQSKIGQMLESDITSDLTYGQSKPATVLLAWNLKEDPSRPYLEALDIRAFHWNP